MSKLQSLLRSFSWISLRYPSILKTSRKLLSCFDNITLKHLINYTNTPQLYGKYYVHKVRCSKT